MSAARPASAAGAAVTNFLRIRTRAPITSPAFLAGWATLPAPAADWPSLEAACTALDAEQLARIEETGAPPTLAPEHLPLLKALIAGQACRGAVLIETCAASTRTRGSAPH